MKEEKFSIDSEDKVEDIIEALGDVKADQITLVVPTNSRLMKEKNGLSKLKEEVLSLDKELIIESVDDKVIATAAKYDIRTLNPIFNSERRVVSDVVVSHKNFKKYPKRKFEWGWSPRISKKWAVVLGIVLVLLVGGVAFAYKELPIAKVNIVLKEFPWDYEGRISIDANISSMNIDKKSVPGMIFKETKTLTSTFPASGRKEVREYAKGTITIFNTFSSQPQILVATTRFEAPDGRIYRIDKRTVVPGTKIVEGTVTPGTVEAAITADEPGERYNNTLLIDHLAIPGFDGTPKFEKFYGQTSVAIRGGFVGIKEFPTAEDIEKGKHLAAESLKDSLRAALLLELPEGFRMVRGAEKFDINEPVINTNNLLDKKFSITVNGAMSVFGLKEVDVRSLLEALAKKELGFVPTNSFRSLEYGEAAPDFNKKTTNLSLAYHARFINSIDSKKFVESVLGKDERDLENSILSTFGVDSATVSLTPFWATKLPKDPSKIRLSITP